MRPSPGLTATFVIGVVGNSVIYLIPLLVGGMISDRGFGEQQAGYMASADLGGYALATMLTALVVNRWSWHRLAFAGLTVIVVANVVTTAVYAPLPFALVRVASGLGSGILAALASVAIGRSGSPDRNFGMLLACSLLFGTAALWGLPLLLGRYGLDAAYWLLAGLAAVTLAVVPRLPRSHAPPADSVPDAAAHSGVSWAAPAMVLLSILLFWASQNDVYAYIERVGNASGLAPEFIGFTLGAANLTGFAGAALVAFLGTRAGRLVPLLVSTAVQLVCLATLSHPVGAWTYFAALCATSLAWNVTNPFQLGILASVDRGGKALALAATVTGAGLAAGPAVAAAAIGVGGYGAVLWTACALAVISLLLLIPVLRRSGGAPRAVAVT